MPKYNDLSLRPQTTASTGGGVASITLNNGVTNISGDTQFINAKGTGTLDVVASIVRGSHTVSGVLDVAGASLFRSAGKFTNGLDVSGGATFKSITGDTIYTTGSASFGPLTIGGLSRLGAVTAGSLQATSLSSTNGVSAGSLVIGGTSSLQGGLTVVGSSNLAGVSSTTLSSGTLTITGQSSLAGVSSTTLSSGTLAITGQSSLAGVSSTTLSSTSLIVSGQTNLGPLSASSIAVSGSSTYAGINCYSLNVSNATTLSTLDVTSNLNVSKIYEKINVIDPATMILDMNLGSSFVLPLSFLPTTNYSIFIINAPLDTNCKTVSLMSRQATTTFYATTLKVSNVSNQFILGTSTSVGSPIFNGGPQTFSTSPCLMIQCFNILSIPDTTNSLGTYSRFVTSSVNYHY